MADLSQGWRERPPVQWMAQAYLGVKSPSKEDDDDDFDRAVAAANGQA